MFKNFFLCMLLFSSFLVCKDLPKYKTYTRKPSLVNDSLLVLTTKEKKDSTVYFCVSKNTFMKYRVVKIDTNTYVRSFEKELVSILGVQR